MSLPPRSPVQLKAMLTSVPQDTELCVTVCRTSNLPLRATVEVTSPSKKRESPHQWGVEGSGF